MFLTLEKEAMKASLFFATSIQGGTEVSVYKRGDRLVYRNIHVNPGGLYSNTTGKYNCEKTGVYYFTYSICIVQAGWTYSLATVTLMKQGVEQAAVSFSNYNTKRIDSTLSQSLVLKCNAGDRVWVESTHSNNFIMESSVKNVFAGVLLFMT